MNSVLLPICVLITLFLSADSQTSQPKPCCTAPVFSAGFAMTYHQDSAGSVVYEEGMYYYDAKKNRTAANVTVTQSNTQISTTQVYQIYDYVKKMSYLILNNKTCQVNRLTDDFPNNGCIPANATFKGTIKLGDSYSVNRWHIVIGASARQEITMTNKCVPVTSSMTITSGGIYTTIAQENFNFKASIDHPDQKFTPPSICNKEAIAEAENDSRHVFNKLFE